MTRFSSAPNWHQEVWMCAIALLAMSALGQAEEQSQIPQVAIDNSGYVFKPIAITPSPNGEDYDGRFLFINRGPSPVMVAGFDKPIHGKFVPQFLDFQTLEDGEWNDILLRYCETGGEDFAMKPGKSYEFHVCLSAFREQATPLTGRIRVGEYWSYPFVLDWKKDRESGEFASVKKEHFKKLRAAFFKAGFKEELLVGDDFPSRLLQSMMKQTTTPEAAAGSFQPFVGALNVIPFIELNGNIRINFQSDDLREDSPQYQGWVSLNPSRFSPRWLQGAAERYVSATVWGDHGMGMRLNDGTYFDSPLFLSINYVPHDKSKVPTVKDSETLFKRILDVFAQWLKEPSRPPSNKPGEQGVAPNDR